MKKPGEIVKEITSKFGGYYCDVKSQLEAEFIAAIQADRDEREKVTNERDMYIRKCDDLGTEAQRDESKNWQELANGWQQQSNKFESERDQLKAQLEALNDPTFDGTDAAHPAWWRGLDCGSNGAVARIRSALDGKDDGSGMLGGAELEKARRDVLLMCSQLDEAVKLLPRLRAHICELTRVREKYVDARGNEDFRETVAEIDSVLAKVKGEKQ